LGCWVCGGGVGGRPPHPQPPKPQSPIPNPQYIRYLLNNKNNSIK